MTKPGYSRLQILLHWLIALLIIVAWQISDGMGRALRQHLESGGSGFADATLHVWIGVAVFALVLLRIIVRWGQGAPAPVAGTPPLLALVAKLGHALLYLLMIVVPTSGIAAWFLRIGEAGEVHELAADGLMIVALLHALAAIWHQFGRRDGTLTRMVRARG